MTINRRQFLVATAVSVPAFVGACATTASSAFGADAMLKGLSSGLGVSSAQALGGTGALMNVAKSSMGGNFGSISSALPGLDGLMGDATKAAGGSLPTTMAGATESFRKLGLSPDQVGKFGGYITNYLGSNSGGSAAASALKGAWGL